MENLPALIKERDSNRVHQRGLKKKEKVIDVSRRERTPT